MDKEGMRGLKILKIRMNIQKNFCKTFQCITILQIGYKEMQTDGLQNRSPSVKNRSLYQQSDRHFNENRNSQTEPELSLLTLKDMALKTENRHSVRSVAGFS